MLFMQKCRSQKIDKMSDILFYKPRVENDRGFDRKPQHPSHGEGEPQDKKRSFNAKECQEGSQSMVERRMLRCNYRSLKNSIAEEKEEILKAESDKFERVFSKVQNLHNLVCRPREQVADAEALLDITSALLTSVKSSHNSNGISLSDFISALVRSYSEKKNGNMSLRGYNNQTNISWETLGLEASTIFSHASGTSTMLGPMDSEAKPRRVVSMRRHRKPIDSTRPEVVAEFGSEQRTETDKNMATMFNILKKHKHVRLEALVLNRQSFSQTVENIFALSFLVKDGRVEIKLDENNNHIIVPRNAPTASDMASGNASYDQFVFRFDFKDWKFMMETIDSGLELMPHRDNSLHHNSQSASETPIRKISRNRGREAPSTLGAQECSSTIGEEKDFSERPVVKRSKQLV